MKSGHSCGKDWLSGRIGLWFNCAFYPSYVITTGPTDRQVKTIMWGEIRAAYKNAKYPIGGVLLPEGAELKSIDKVTGLRDPYHRMFGFVGKTPEAFQGYHNDNVLIIVTEAQGIKPPVWEAINSLMTAPNARLLAIGNPSYEPDSVFFGMFNDKADMYHCITLDSEKSSHCSKAFIADMEREGGGRDSPLFQIRVKGNFPDNISDTLIPHRWIEEACDRWEEESHEGPVTLGADVARHGSDETVFYRGEGNRFSCVHRVQGQDLMQTTGQVIVKVKDFGIPFENVRLDDTGIGGGVTDRLKELGHKICPINFGSKPSQGEKYFNARSEMFGLLRDRFREGRIAIDPNDKKLRRDLSTIKYKINSKGQIQLEDKADTKKRLGYSPDSGDAIALAALPQHVAKLVATGKLPNMGLLELMESQSRSIKLKQEHPELDRSLKSALTATPVMNTPGAALLGEGHGQSGWRSVAP